MTNQEFKKEAFSHGKLLLSGEYFLLDGATSLSLPTKKGQGLKVFTQKNVDKHIVWSSFDENGSTWFYARFDRESLDCIESTCSKHTLIVKKILSKLKDLGKFDFLGYHQSLIFRSNMEFPIEWGIGASSTLINNLAKIFELDPMDLGRSIFGGSLYDVATAINEKAILYKNDSEGPSWKESSIHDDIKGNLYFIHLNLKADTKNAIKVFKDRDEESKAELKIISNISKDMSKATSLNEFESLLEKHENIISTSMNMEKIKESKFSDFWGKIKSLGDWGGDFILATSDKDSEETKEYFRQKGLKTVMSYDELVLQ